MIDHLVLATDDLERTVRRIADDWQIVPTPGGAHVGRGTRNELVALGGGAYLEIIGPDLAQTDHTGPRPFGVDDLSGQRLVAWCARPETDLHTVDTLALQLGHDIGQVTSMSRRRPDGVLLEWRLTFPAVGTVLPFLIDWQDSQHPTASLDQPVELLELQLETSTAEFVRDVVAVIGNDARVTVEASSTERLSARLRTPSGLVSL